VDANEQEEMVKVGFRLDRDQNDYPPANWEWLWASRISDATFKIDNIPFFAKLVSCGDIVTATQTDAGFVFKKLIQPSGHSTVRVVIFREGRNDQQLVAEVEAIRQFLRTMGCSTELSHIPNLIAVDIPPEVDYRSISAFLSRKEHDGVLEYEEACLAPG
jgi:Domain of unknown function (DUF4265)